MYPIRHLHNTRSHTMHSLRTGVLVVAAISLLFAWTAGATASTSTSDLEDARLISRERTIVVVPASVAGEEVKVEGWRSLYLSGSVAPDIYAEDSNDLESIAERIAGYGGCSTETWLGDPTFSSHPYDQGESSAYVDRGAGCPDGVGWYHNLYHENFDGNMVVVDSTGLTHADPGEKVWTHVSRACNSTQYTKWMADTYGDWNDQTPEVGMFCET